LYELPDAFRCELIDGVLIELSPPGGEHAGIASEINGLLREFVKPRGLGRVVGEMGFVLRRDPDTVRAPDVAFIRAEHIPPTGLGRGFWDGSPDLVIEVISPSNTASEMQGKLRDWIEGGARLS